MSESAQVTTQTVDKLGRKRERRADGTFATPDAARAAVMKRHRKAYTPAELTKRLRQVITPGALEEVTRNMLRIATGQTGASAADQATAARLIYDRLLGKPHQSTTITHEQQPGSERVILQQIAVILDRQPDLRAMLTGDQQRDIIDAPQDTSGDAAPQPQDSDPPPPQSE